MKNILITFTISLDIDVLNMIGENIMKFFVKMNCENLDTSTVLYMRRTGPYGECNYVLMDKFKMWLYEQNLLCDDTVILGIPLDNPNTTEANKCRYDVCVIDSECLKPDSDEVKRRQIDGGKYVVFLIEHTTEAVQRAWAEFFAELNNNNYLLDTSRPIIERYSKKLVDNNYCELCVPVL